MKEVKGYLMISAVAIGEACKIVGSERELAKRIGVYRQSIRYWRNNTLLPCDKAIKIHIATEGKVKLSKLRPDLEKVLNEYERLNLKVHK